MNFGAAGGIIVHCKTVRLDASIDDRSLDDVASVDSHDGPRPLLMVHAVVEPVSVGDDREVASCAGDSCAGRTGEAYSERHDPSSQCGSNYDDDDAKHLVLQNQFTPACKRRTWNLAEKSC